MKKIFCLFVLLSFSLLIRAEEGDWKFSVTSWNVSTSNSQALVREYEAENKAGEWVFNYDEIDTSPNVDVVYIFKIENSKMEVSFWEFSDQNASSNFLDNSNTPRGFFYGVSLSTGDSWADIYPLPYYNRLSDMFYLVRKERKVKAFELLYKASKLRLGLKYVTIENTSDYLVNMEYYAGLMPFSDEIGKSSQSRVQFSGVGPYIAFEDEFRIKNFSLECRVGLGVLFGKDSYDAQWVEAHDITYGRTREFYEESFPLSQSQADNIFTSGFIVRLNYQISSWTFSIGVKNEKFYDVSMTPLFSSPSNWRSPGVENTWVKSNDNVSLTGLTFGLTYSW